MFEQRLALEGSPSNGSAGLPSHDSGTGIGATETSGGVDWFAETPSSSGSTGHADSGTAVQFSMDAALDSVGHWADSDGDFGDAGQDGAVQDIADTGIADSGHSLPFLNQIQQSFGAFDATDIVAHTGSDARTANERLGANAFATQGHVAFGETPSLFTAAHEAAHHVLQHAGVRPQSGVGEVGDVYEQHADQVAAAVVAGESAEPLLASMAVPQAKPQSRAVQFEKKKEPPRESVVYLGLNDASRETEKKVFQGMDNATVITGSGKDKSMQGKAWSHKPGPDGKPVLLDLSKEADLEQYLTEAGVGNQRKDGEGNATETEEDAQARMEQMKDLFLGGKDEDGQRQGGISTGALDEMVQFVDVLQKVEAGDMTMDRLVMSGHSTGDWVYSEADGNPGVTFAQMTNLMQMFPKAQGGVQDLMLSACHTLEDSQWGDTRKGEQYKEMFPQLQSVWGYNGTSPSWKQGSSRHIQAWMNATEGNDLDKIRATAKPSKYTNSTSLVGDEIGKGRVPPTPQRRR